MRLLSFITLCKVLILTTFLISPSKAETTCTYNELGDQTCVTTTTTKVPGVTTDNLLSQDFSDGSWSDNGTGQLNTMHGSGTVAGIDGGQVKSTISLNDTLTKEEINSGFSSTLGADIWFCNSYTQSVTMRQTLTDDNGNSTTQQRTIDYNTNYFETHTDTIIVSENSKQDYAIQSEFIFSVPGYRGHYGADLQNPTLNVTTNTTTETSTTKTFTPCSELGTCTYDNEAVEDAVDLRTEDGKPIFDDVDDKVGDAVKDFEEVKFTPIVETVIEVKDDLGNIEEVKFEEFVEMQFTSFIEENNLVEEFKEELKVEGLTEEEFFDELSGAMKEELGGEIMADMEEFKEEEMPNDITTEAPTEDIKEETTTEEFKEEKTEEGELNATETTTNEKTETEEIVQGNEEEDKTGPEDENVSAKSEVDNDKETEGQTETEDSGETVEDTAGVSIEDGKSLDAKVSSITEKVARVIKKLEQKLKRVDDKLNATAYVLAVGLQSTQPDISSYSNKRIYQNNNLGYNTNDDFFDLINRIEQQQIYKDVNLNAYTSKDPIAVQSRLLNEIDQKRAKLMAEIAALRSM